MKHIEIKTKKSDIQEFYVEILGGIISRHYTLPEKDAVKKYHLPLQLEVYELKIQNKLLDLLVYEVFEQDSLDHIYLELDNASKIYFKAEEKKYIAKKRKNGKSETYFIIDSNNNLFEIKDKRLFINKKQNQYSLLKSRRPYMYQVRKSMHA